MAEQLQLDFSQSTTQRTRRAEKHRDQLTLFASWAPNVDVTLLSPTEAVAHVAGKEPERSTDWVRGLVGGGRLLNRRRVAFPVTNLDKLGWVRPPAQVSLDAATLALARAFHAHALGYRPPRIHRQGRRVVASSPRGWPAGFRIVDAPWNAVEALLTTDLPLTIDKNAEEAVAKRLERSGAEVAKATLSGNSILITTGRTTLLERRDLPALSYVGEPGSGTYRMPLLLGSALLEETTIKVDAKTEAAIKRATRPVKPLIIEDEDFPWQLWDFQAEDAATGMRALKATGGVMFAGSMGSGKCVISSTIVFTNNGPKQMGDLVVGDHVLAPNGLPTRVQAVYHKTDWDLYRVTFSDKTSVLAGAEHRWWVQTPSQKYHGNPGKFMTTGEILEAGIKYANGNRKYYIPMPDPLEFDKRDLPIPAYVLGALLGDGWCTPDGQVHLADHDGDVFFECLRELRQDPAFDDVPFRMSWRAGTPGDRDTDSWHTRGYSNTLSRRLQQLGLAGRSSWEKFVPEDYLYTTSKDRLALLQGLLDTDGSCTEFRRKGEAKSNTGYVEFTSTSEDLADAVVWLVQSLGGRASKGKPVRNTYTMPDGSKRRGRPAWRLGISLPSDISPFRIPAKAEKYTPRTKYQPTRAIETIEYWGKSDATCITVEDPSEQFVIENGIVTGNTTVSLGVLHEMDLWPALLIGPVTAGSTWHRQVGEMGKSLYMATNSPKKDWKEISENDYDAYFITFDRLESFTELLATKGLKVIVADELQKAKNAGSRRSRALRTLASAAPYRIGLSGTPLVGGLSDLLAQFSFLLPTEFPPRASQKSLEDRYPGDAVEALTEHVHSVMVRRRMDEVGKKLAPREDHKVYVNLTPEQEAAIRAVEEEARLAKEAGELDGPDGRMNALVLLGKIRGIIANPRNAGVQGPNPKLAAALKLIRQAKKDGIRPVVFMQDRASFQDMADLLDTEGIVWGGINGSTSIDDRVEVERRLHNLELDCVLCSMAGAESWTASPTATMCILVTATYSAAVNEQAESRVYRLNSNPEDTVRIIYIHAKSPSGQPSSDDRLFEILEMKKSIFAQVIDRREYESNTDIADSMSDLMYILTGEKDEQLEKLEADQQRAGEAKRKQREHARATLYKNKGSNRADPDLVHDDGTTAVVKDE